MVLAKISKYLGDKAGPGSEGEGASRALYRRECLPSEVCILPSLPSLPAPATWHVSRMSRRMNTDKLECFNTHHYFHKCLLCVCLNIGLNIKSNTVSTYWGSSLTFAWTRCVECPGIRQRGDSGRARQPGARQREPGLSVQKCCNNSVVCESAANRRPVFRSHDQCYPITGDLVTSSSRTQCHHHNWPQVQHLLGNEDGHYSTVSLSVLFTPSSWAFTESGFESLCPVSTHCLHSPLWTELS